jgi:hypothetical protein
MERPIPAVPNLRTPVSFAPNLVGAWKGVTELGTGLLTLSPGFGRPEPVWQGFQMEKPIPGVPNLRTPLRFAPFLVGAWSEVSALLFDMSHRLLSRIDFARSVIRHASVMCKINSNPLCDCSSWAEVADPWTSIAHERLREHDHPTRCLVAAAAGPVHGPTRTLCFARSHSAALRRKLLDTFGTGRFDRQHVSWYDRELGIVSYVGTRAASGREVVRRVCTSQHFCLFHVLIKQS